ncbi:MAG: gamma-glutamylcyclotransferase family protein [Dehalococcoidales bacterium]|nr:gamma-glutamylcyclotransferase family protein [Dehalococcoidales bacterium]
MYYFAYATDLNRKLLKERCPDSVPKYTAKLPNYKVVFTGWLRKWRGGTATIKFSSGDKVRGGVYEISERDLSRLDSLEGYPNNSNRLNVTVFTLDDEAVQAITYSKTGKEEESKPSPEYLAIIQQGYRDWRLF